MSDIYENVRSQIPTEFRPILDAQKRKGEQEYGQPLSKTSPLSGQIPTPSRAILEGVQELIDCALYFELSQSLLEGATNKDERHRIAIGYVYRSLDYAYRALDTILETRIDLPDNRYNLEKPAAD